MNEVQLCKQLYRRHFEQDVFVLDKKFSLLFAHAWRMWEFSKLCSHELKSLTECNGHREENSDSDPCITTIEAEDVQEAFDRLKKRTASAIGTPKVYLSL